MAFVALGLLSMVFIAMIVAVCWAMRDEPDAQAAVPAPPVEPGRALRATTGDGRVCVQLVGATDRGEHVLLDILLLEDVDTGVRLTESGTPIMIRVDLSASDAIRPVIRGMLHRWADEMRVVELELCGDGRVVIHNDGASVLVHVARVVGVNR